MPRRTGDRPPYPAAEGTILLRTVLRAEALAACGRIADGDALLGLGQRRALRLAGEGMPWGDRLAERYQFARDEYAHRHSFVDELRLNRRDGT